MCCRYSIRLNICPLYFLPSLEGTTHCYFAVFLKLPTAAPRGKIKFMFGISICFVSFVCNNHFILKPYLPCTYIFCHNKIAVILLFFSSLQELLPGARSNVSVLNWILHRFSVTQRTMDSICSTILKIVTARCLEKGTRLIDNLYVHIGLKWIVAILLLFVFFPFFWVFWWVCLQPVPGRIIFPDNFQHNGETAKIQIIMILSLSLPFFC